MRGNWDTAEPLVHAPNQQRQQQQQTIVEEQRHPLHSPTTPVWGIPDRIVKEEPSEDKNNDSGVSPDYYTSNSASPRSRRSSSTANCSLSPGSATSQDSSTMQCSAFDYSPQRMFKNCGSPLEYNRHHSMNDHQSDQAMDVASSTVKPSNEDVEFVQDTLQCPICAFTTLNRLAFTDHLRTHCTIQCETTDFVKTILGQLSTSGSIQDENRSTPPQGERSKQMEELEEADEPGLRVPRLNSQGKVKTFRCKQCDFTAITKLEFWEHSRGHIKAEKLLTCTRCPFVTEYKHHLEYHMRNHAGSKPFKCDKCSYSCVNKSMLNSHLKSHSNVYQYRCANCSYATKYCHSLKLHLRKYSHQPAMVLNADGSPNPLPIIDVYGTRRGPKPKSVKIPQEDSSQTGNVVPTNNNLQISLSSSQIVVPSQMSPVNYRVSMNSVNSLNGANTPNGLNGAVPNPSLMAFSYNQIFAGFPLATAIPVAFEENSVEKQLDRIRSHALMDYAKVIDPDSSIPEEIPQDLEVKCFDSIRTCDESNDLINNDLAKINGAPMPNMENQEQRKDSKVTPLDLSKPNVPSNVQSRPTTNSSKLTGTSRRKGRAVKLERRVVEEDTDDEHLPGEPEEMYESAVPASPVSRDDKETNERTSTLGNEFTCQYCEIAFGNVVMYTVHMGYHGYKDPYTCNMCGHQCTDKVSFFLHIARSKHS
ncbi:protein hunchback [Osmia bicornis bicornis]|uniref:protein hunchback n=1 Tax=Osmia bicornis bicornis TaxID=1437191 RepID=UPI001EAEC0BB|nr:protein hunchback [Osmia bicornis bicornis]XP_029033502.2 protein hunchback [Osmia bicornis bicornis]